MFQRDPVRHHLNLALSLPCVEAEAPVVVVVGEVVPVSGPLGAVEVTVVPGEQVLGGLRPGRGHAAASLPDVVAGIAGSAGVALISRAGGAGTARRRIGEAVPGGVEERLAVDLTGSQVYLDRLARGDQVAVLVRPVGEVEEEVALVHRAVQITEQDALFQAVGVGHHALRPVAGVVGSVEAGAVPVVGLTSGLY